MKTLKQLQQSSKLLVHQFPILMVFQGGAPPLAGFLYDVQGTYFTAMIIAWSLSAIAVVAMFLCTPPVSAENQYT